MRKTLITKLLGVALLLANSTILAATACTDSNLSSSAVSAIRQNMRYDAVAAILGCDGTAGSAYGNLGVTTVPYYWRSQNRIIEVIITNGLVDSVSDLSVSTSTGTPTLANPATFDASTNNLSIPALTAGGILYTNTVVYLNPNGHWALTALADANGNALPVPVPPAPPTSLTITGNILGYSGVILDTIFTIGGQTWRGRDGCNFPSPVTPPAVGVQPDPSATIYQMGAEYVLTVVGSPLVCKVERLI